MAASPANQAEAEKIAATGACAMNTPTPPPHVLAAAKSLAWDELEERQRDVYIAYAAALEEAARACEEVRAGGDSFKEHEDNHEDGHTDGCNNCAAAIRALADPLQALHDNAQELGAKG